MSKDENIRERLRKDLEWFKSWESDLSQSSVAETGLEDLLDKISEFNDASNFGETAPIWLKSEALLKLRLKAFEWATGKVARDWLEAPTRYLLDLGWEIDELYRSEQVGPKASKLLRHLYEKIYEMKNQEIDAAWTKHTGNQRSFIRNAERGSGVGYAAHYENWEKYWDDRWLARRENDKGWKYSAADILNALPDGVTKPDESTIRKHRLRIQKLREAKCK